MLRKNRNVVLREHVLNMQQFELNKHKLWRQLQARLAIYDALSLINRRMYLKAMRKKFSGCVTNPSGCKAIGTIWIQRSVQNKLKLIRKERKSYRYIAAACLYDRNNTKKR